MIRTGNIIQVKKLQKNFPHYRKYFCMYAWVASKYGGRLNASSKSTIFLCYLILVQ